MHAYTYTCRIHIDAIIKTRQSLWPSALCLSRSPGLLNQRPRAPFRWMRAFSTTSCHQWVFKLTRGSRGPLLLGGGFLYHILSLTHLISNSKLTDFLSTPSYIIVQSPTQYLFLWLARPEYATSGVFGQTYLIIIKRK